MIHVVEAVHAHHYTQELEAMFRLRTYIFRDKLGWDVAVNPHGQEKDAYDHETAVYLLHINDATGELNGSLRLMPTTGPTLLGDVFRSTVPENFAFEAPTVWECTRFCVDDRITGIDSPRIASELLFGIGEVGIAAGLTTIVGNFVPSMLRVYQRAGCALDVVGKSDLYGEPVYLGAFEVAQEVLDGMRVRLGIEGSLLAKPSVTGRHALAA